jgi:hypothetical protein
MLRPNRVHAPSRARAIAGVLLLSAAAAACGSNEPLTPTSPSAPATSVTETFEGTLTVNGAVTHPFSVSTVGLVSASLTSLSPDNTAIVGLSLGTWNGSACQIILANDSARQGSSVTGNATSIGSFCARVYDVGRLAGPTDYAITVTHY